MAYRRRHGDAGCGDRDVWLGGGFRVLALAMVLLALGTAMAYATLLATIGDVAHPGWRGSAMGVYRLWRDGGYVLGAALAGLLADLLGLDCAVGMVGGLRLLSAVVAALVMRETLPANVPSAKAEP